MKKLRLAVDDLQVETFVLSLRRELRGTVAAHSAMTCGCATGAAQYTCGPQIECAPTVRYPECEGTPTIYQTCGQLTCAGTCYETESEYAGGPHTLCAGQCGGTGLPTGGLQKTQCCPTAQ